MSALGEILRGALEQRASGGARGLMKPGKAPLMERLAFLLSTGRDERNYAIGRYLVRQEPWPSFGEVSPREAQLARAEAMGFDTSRTFYRGSHGDESVAVPNEGTYGRRYYINRTPDRASEHAGIYDEEPNGGNVMPLFVRRGKFQSTVGAEGGVADGRDVRSIFAQFDPAKANSADLLAGVAIGAPIAGLTLREALRGRMIGEA